MFTDASAFLLFHSLNYTEKEEFCLSACLSVCPRVCVCVCLSVCEVLTWNEHFQQFAVFIFCTLPKGILLVTYTQCTVRCVLCIEPVPEEQRAATAWRQETDSRYWWWNMQTQHGETGNRIQALHAIRHSSIHYSTVPLHSPKKKSLFLKLSF